MRLSTFSIAATNSQAPASRQPLGSRSRTVRRPMRASHRIHRVRFPAIFLRISPISMHPDERYFCQISRSYLVTDLYTALMQNGGVITSTPGRAPHTVEVTMVLAGADTAPIQDAR